MRALTKRLWMLIFIGVCAATSVFALASLTHKAYASVTGKNDPAPTVLKIDPIGSIVEGRTFTVTGILYRPVEGGNAGIPNRSVKLYIEPITTTNGIISNTFLVANVFSNKEGRLSWVVHSRLYSGHYRVYYLFQGTHTLYDSVATTDLYVTTKQTWGYPKGVRRGTLPAQLSVTTAVSPSEAGERVTIIVSLTAKLKSPLANYNVYFHVPGATQQRKTDTNGTAVFVIKKPLLPGSHLGRVTFLGKDGYQPAEAQVLLSVAAPAQTTLALAQKIAKKMYVGDALVFDAHLEADGKPVLNQLVRFYLDGTHRYGAKTDGEGKAVLRLPRNLIAGSHVISATFHGTDSLLGATGTLRITLLPKPFEVRTVPPLPDVSIRVGEKLIQTDKRGVARLLVKSSGIVSVTVLPYASPDPNIRAEFVRWSDEVFSTTRKINVVNGVMYQIGFEVSHPILPKFVEEGSGREVDSKRLGSIMLVSSAGEAVALKEASVQWMKANRIMRHDDALTATSVFYHLRNVIVDGVNVVNEGQQRFKARPNARWTVKLQMHDLAVVVRDALFGFPIGKGMRVTYPMGQLLDVALDSSGRMRIESLSRGSYTVTVQGALAIRTPMPVALSRSQDVDLAVISYLDIGIVAGMLASVALFVLLIGRLGVFARLRHLVFRRTRPA